MKKLTFSFLILSFLSIQDVWSQDTIVLQPGTEGKDAVFADYPPDVNHGNSPKFYCMAWTHGGIPASHRSVIEFDLSMIPPGGGILDARLNLYYVCQEPTYTPQTGENESYLQLITSEWDEGTVTWNNQPSVTTEDQVYLPNSTEPEQDYTNIDVTILVSKMYSEPENYHGFSLNLITEEYYRCLLFASGDYLGNPELRPKLEIIYMSCVPPTAHFEYQKVGQVVSFTGISPTAISWHWDFGDGDTSNIQNPEHVYQQPGFYQVYLRVEDTCYFAEHSEMIEICLEPPVSGFTYLTEDLSVSFQDTSIMAAEYYWDFGDGYFSSLSDPWHNYELPGEYLVCLTTWNSCGSDTACELLDLCIPPMTGFTYLIDDLTVFFEDISLYADLYYWDFGDGYYSNLSNPSHTYDMEGNYMVCLMTENACGYDTACEYIDFNTTSVPDHDPGLFKIYPNPASNLVFIKSFAEGLVTISMSDLSGKEVLLRNKDVTADETIKIPLGNIEPGIYIIRFDSGKTQAYGKLVVVR